MSDKNPNPPESPTTVQPLDFDDDDDDIQESGVINMGDSTTKPNPATTAAAGAPTGAATGASPPNTTPTNPSTTASEEAPPPKPPRPVTEQQKNEMILKEAFPDIDASVIKAVLIASRGQIDPAFNALLGMSDPDAVQHDADDEAPPPPPPRRPQNAQSQLEADEAYARQLAQHYETQSAAYEARTSNRGPANPPRRQQTGLKPNELYDDREHSFLDDDLPVIQEQLKKGFQETQTKVNSWFKDLKKKFDEQFDEEGSSSQQGGGRGPLGGRGSGESARRSRDYERYDADPELLSDDFAGMKFHSDGTPAGQRTQNPNLFKPPPPSTSPKPGGDGRKVAFKDGTEEIYSASPKNAPKDAAAAGPGGKSSKWQPLSAVEPSPIAENDPFSLGDSDDDKDAKEHKSDKGGIKMEEKVEDADEERLRKAAAEAMADSLVDEKDEKDEAKK